MKKLQIVLSVLGSFEKLINVFQNDELSFPIRDVMKLIPTGSSL